MIRNIYSSADITRLARKIEMHFVEKMVELITTWSTYARLRWYCSFSRCTVRRLFSTSCPSFLQSPIMFGSWFWSPVQVHSSSSLTRSATSSLSVWLSPVCCRQTSNGWKKSGTGWRTVRFRLNEWARTYKAGTTWGEVKSHIYGLIL